MAQYTREVTIKIAELIPDKSQLPYCSAWLKNGDNCPRKAKFEQEGNPVCGIHLGKPNTIWIP